MSLEKAGADLLLLAGDTMHRVADRIESAVSIPFLHLIELTAQRIKAAGIIRVGLTGTTYTMTERFFIDRLEGHGIQAIIPSPEDREQLDKIIYGELIWGTVTTAAKSAYAKTVQNLISAGAEGIILGCTELTLFMPLDFNTIFFDTTQIHIEETLNIVCGDLGPRI